MLWDFIKLVVSVLLSWMVFLFLLGFIPVLIIENFMDKQAAPPPAAITESYELDYAPLKTPEEWGNDVRKYERVPE